MNYLNVCAKTCVCAIMCVCAITCVCVCDNVCVCVTVCVCHCVCVGGCALSFIFSHLLLQLRLIWRGRDWMSDHRTWHNSAMTQTITVCLSLPCLRSKMFQKWKYPQSCSNHDFLRTLCVLRRTGARWNLPDFQCLCRKGCSGCLERAPLLKKCAVRASPFQMWFDVHVFLIARFIRSCL